VIGFARTIKKKLDKLKRAYMPATLVLGDSHVCIFERWPFTVFFPFVNFDVCMIAGATVSGLANPNSTTKAMPKFNEAIQSRNFSKVIVNLGEVDAGYVIWYRAEKNEKDVNSMLSDALNKYSEFLLKIKEKSTDVTVLSAPLPTIRDNNDWGEIANLRKEVKASQEQRTLLTIKFNQHMELFCQQNGLSYLNFDSTCLGNNGTLRPFFYNKDKNDHHYAYNAYSYIVVKAMYKKVFGQWIGSKNGRN